MLWTGFRRAASYWCMIHFHVKDGHIFGLIMVGGWNFISHGWSIVITIFTCYDNQSCSQNWKMWCKLTNIKLLLWIISLLKLAKNSCYTKLNLTVLFCVSLQDDYKSSPNFQISDVTHSDIYARNMRRNNSEGRFCFVTLTCTHMHIRTYTNAHMYTKVYCILLHKYSHIPYTP